MQYYYNFLYQPSHTQSFHHKNFDCGLSYFSYSHCYCQATGMAAAGGPFNVLKFEANIYNWSRSLGCKLDTLARN